jgi:hypothetical protein
MCDEEDEYYMRKELRDAGSTGKSCPRRRSFGSWRWIVNFNSLKIMRGEFAEKLHTFVAGTTYTKHDQP